MGRKLLVLGIGMIWLPLHGALVAGCGRVLEEHTILVYADGGEPDTGGENTDSGAIDPECTSGACCSDERFAGGLTVCDTRIEYQCTTGQCGGIRQQRGIRQYCSGTSAGCEGAIVTDPWQDIESCASDELCVADAASEPTCSKCANGCDSSTHTCKNASKLWMFQTAGAYLGNNFGGNDHPADVRAGADGRCLSTYTAFYGARACEQANVHAILNVNGSDSIQLMRTLYGVPADIPIHRADDQALVSDSWTAFTGLEQLHAAPSTAQTDADGQVWTGADANDTCVNWTSDASGDFGTYGYANRLSVSWLYEGAMRCDRLAGLLCVCW